MNAAIQPSLPRSRSTHSYMTSAGAAPNDTMSARLSNSAPNALCVLVSRATRPSRLSSTAATKIAMAAWSKLRFIACTIA